MLKTIEEPPAYGIVILLANNPDVFLQTEQLKEDLSNLRIKR